MGGLRTAESLRRSGFDGEITLIGAESHPPYNRPPLSKELLANDKDLSAVAFPIKEGELRAQLLLGEVATSLTLSNREVTLASGKSIPFDYLVAATGLRSRQMTFPNDLRSGRFSLRTFDDAKRLRKEATPGTSVVILGAGFIGLELAATLRRLGCSVDVVAIESTPLAPILGEEFGAEVQRRHEAEGVRFHLQQTVQDLIGDERIEGVRLNSGETIECSVFIEAVGSIPNTEWLAGNELDLSNGVLTDQSLRGMCEDGTSVDDLFVVGDIARFPYAQHPLPARRIEHWNIPIESAKRVGREISHHSAPGSVADFVMGEHFNPLPSFWSDQFAMSILSYGEPKLADEVTLLEGDLANEFVFGYRRNGDLVGVAGVGMRREVNKFRGEIRL
jgi:3-phenylpropionate/trans-cinnamate dioxygenase ferredoxin reductase subunit